MELLKTVHAGCLIQAVPRRASNCPCPSKELTWIPLPLQKPHVDTPAPPKIHGVVAQEKQMFFSCATTPTEKHVQPPRIHMWIPLPLQRSTELWHKTFFFLVPQHPRKSMFNPPGCTACFKRIKLLGGLLSDRLSRGGPLRSFAKSGQDRFVERW